jgi:hypothetical protein
MRSEARELESYAELAALEELRSGETHFAVLLVDDHGPVHHPRKCAGAKNSPLFGGRHEEWGIGADGNVKPSDLQITCCLNRGRSRSPCR